jgi:hypothetical protein
MYSCTVAQSSAVFHKTKGWIKAASLQEGDFIMGGEWSESTPPHAWVQVRKIDPPFMENCHTVYGTCTPMCLVADTSRVFMEAKSTFKARTIIAFKWAPVEDLSIKWEALSSDYPLTLVPRCLMHLQSRLPRLSESTKLGFYPVLVAAFFGKSIRDGASFRGTHRFFNRIFNTTNVINPYTGKTRKLLVDVNKGNIRAKWYPLIYDALHYMGLFQARRRAVKFDDFALTLSPLKCLCMLQLLALPIERRVTAHYCNQTTFDSVQMRLHKITAHGIVSYTKYKNLLPLTVTHQSQAPCLRIHVSHPVIIQNHLYLCEKEY